MKKLSVLSLFVLASCATQFSLPVVGRLSNGDTAQGSVSLEIGNPLGKFEVFTLSGLNCVGTYDANSTISTLVIPIVCNDGITGTVIATRDASLAAGTAEARLSNGLSGRFLFGATSAQQQSEFLDQR